MQTHCSAAGPIPAPRRAEAFEVPALDRGPRQVFRLLGRHVEGWLKGELPGKQMSHEKEIIVQLAVLCNSEALEWGVGCPSQLAPKAAHPFHPTSLTMP